MFTPARQSDNITYQAPRAKGNQDPLADGNLRLGLPGDPIIESSKNGKVNDNLSDGIFHELEDEYSVRKL